MRGKATDPESIQGSVQKPTRGKPPVGRGGARPNSGPKPDTFKHLFDTAIREVVTQDEMTAMVRATVGAAKDGNVKAFGAILERMLGKVPQAVQMTGADEGPLRIIVEFEG